MRNKLFYNYQSVLYEKFYILTRLVKCIIFLVSDTRKVMAVSGGGQHAVIIAQEDNAPAVGSSP